MESVAGARLSEQWARRAPLIAAFIALAAAFATMTADLVGVYYDDAIYALLAKAIAEGNGFVYLSIPGNPPAVHYPPLYPAVLAVVWKVAPSFPGNIAWLKIVNPLMLSAAAYGAVLVGQRVLGLRWWIALGTVVVGTVSVPVLMLTNPLLSEPMFLALLFPALLTAEWALTERGPWALAIAAAVAGLLVLERTIGGVVVIATFLWLVWDRRWAGAALYAAVVAVVIAPWQYFVWVNSPLLPPEISGSYGPYLAWIVDGYRQGGWEFADAVFQKNAVDAWRTTGSFLTPYILGPARQVATTIAALFLGFGILAAVLRPGARVTGLATFGYLTMVVIWPFRIERFLWAIWPLILLLACAGVAWFRRELLADGRPRLAIFSTILAGLLVIGHVTYNVRGHSRGWAMSASAQTSRNAEPKVRYVQRDPRIAGLRIATEEASMIALYTGREVIPIESLLPEDHLAKRDEEQSSRLIAELDRRFRPGAYVLSLDGPLLRPLLATKFDGGRTLVPINPPGHPVQTFLVQVK